MCSGKWAARRNYSVQFEIVNFLNKSTIFTGKQFLYTYILIAHTNIGYGKSFINREKSPIKCTEHISFHVFYEDKKKTCVNQCNNYDTECAIVSRIHVSPCFLTLYNVIKENRTMPVSAGVDPALGCSSSDYCRVSINSSGLILYDPSAKLKQCSELPSCFVVNVISSWNMN